jgi:hypothetical protein
VAVEGSRRARAETVSSRIDSNFNRLEVRMNVLRVAVVLVLVFVSLTTLGSAAQAGVEMTAVSSCAMDGARSGAASAILCVRYFCPIYPEFGCSCELVWCNGDYVCGEPR